MTKWGYINDKADDERCGEKENCLLSEGEMGEDKTSLITIQVLPANNSFSSSRSVNGAGSIASAATLLVRYRIEVTRE
jgi:hypothetical protein